MWTLLASASPSLALSLEQGELQPPLVVLRMCNA
jgi:hypothetical protein